MMKYSNNVFVFQVLTDASSSDSSPSHLDSCNNTLVQDLSPTANIIHTQPTLHRVSGSDVHTLQPSTDEHTPQHKPTPLPEQPNTTPPDAAVMKPPIPKDTESTLPPDTTEKPDSRHTDTKQEVDVSDARVTGITSAVKDLNAAIKTSQSTHKSSEGTSSSQGAVSALMDCALPKVPRQATTQDSEVTSTIQPTHIDAQPTATSTTTITSTPSTEEHSVEEADVSMPSTTALDVSVESGGSSDTITASIDSTQTSW